MKRNKLNLYNYMHSHSGWKCNNTRISDEFDKREENQFWNRFGSSATRWAVDWLPANEINAIFKRTMMFV